MVKQASQFGLAIESHVAKGVKADPMASIHKSVKARWDADSDYRPRALVKHLESQKDSKGGGWNLVS